jgi:hypothetical protein
VAAPNIKCKEVQGKAVKPASFCCVSLLLAAGEAWQDSLHGNSAYNYGLGVYRHLGVVHIRIFAQCGSRISKAEVPHGQREQRDVLGFVLPSSPAGGSFFHTMEKSFP